MDQNVIIAGVTIIQDANGRYNLNTLHQASEAAQKREKAPGEWLRRKTTQALIRELEATQDVDLRLGVIEVVHGGERVGTYAHELLAVEYAGWISPSFRLKVNQAFIDLRTRPQAQGAIHPVHDPVDRYPELRAIRELIVATAEARDEAAMARHEAQESRQVAARAETKADLALADSRHQSLEDFVLLNHLMQQFPVTDWPQLGKRLQDYCILHALKTYKVPVAGKQWSEETVYPLQALAWLARYPTPRMAVLRFTKDAC
jgi:hypothetical protein